MFSRTLEKASWNNTKLVKTDSATEIRKLKREPGPDMVIMGSGTIVSRLTQARLIDEYQVVVISIVLGQGRTMFEGIFSCGSCIRYSLPGFYRRFHGAPEFRGKETSLFPIDRETHLA